jgi:hypothetical protein
MTLDEYYQLLNAGQTYVQGAQAADPAWQDWLTSQSNYNLDTAGSVASPTTDYWGQYMATLSPQQQAEFAQMMAQLKDDRWTTKVGSVMQYIPAVVGTIGLAGASGLLGPAAGFPGEAIWAPAAEAAAGAAAAPAAEAATSTLPLWDTGVGPLFGSQAAIDSSLAAANWFPGASLAAAEGFGAGNLMLADLLPATFTSTLGAPAAQTLWDKIVDKAPDLLKKTGDLLDGPDSGGGGFGGSMQLGGGGLLGPGKPYTPPATPAMAPFKASTALADLARSMTPRRPTRGLLGY